MTADITPFPWAHLPLKKAFKGAVLGQRRRLEVVKHAHGCWVALSACSRSGWGGQRELSAAAGAAVAHGLGEGPLCRSCQVFSHDCKHLKTADWLARSLARERETRGWWSHDGWTLARASMSIGVLNHLETLHEARCKQRRPRCPSSLRAGMALRRSPVAFSLAFHDRTSRHLLQGRAGPASGKLPPEPLPGHPP